MYLKKMNYGYNSYMWVSRCTIKNMQLKKPGQQLLIIFIIDYSADYFHD